MVKESDFFIGKEIISSDIMQEKEYKYIISEKMGKSASDFHKHDFYPQLSPKEMLEKGIFEGAGGYLGGGFRDEIPEEWFINLDKKMFTISAENNYFKVKSRLSLLEWKKRKWIIGDDPRGWFQWYCRWTLGRRTPYDKKQISRWKSFKRHIGQIKKNCQKGDFSCRKKQRQSLLQWAYDSTSDNL